MTLLHMEDLAFDFPCARCGALNKATFNEAKEGKMIRCGSCGSEFRLSLGPRKDMLKVQEDLDRMLVRLREKIPF
jgi:transcription elongation factor Elf1